jgi:hypothetical protein
VPASCLALLCLLQLVLPPGLLGSCLQRVVALSRAFHDEECEDLSEVTWSEVAARLGLNIEVRDDIAALGVAKSADGPDEWRSRA